MIESMAKGKSNMKWIGSTPHVMKYAKGFKKELRPLNPWEVAKKVQFRFCSAWVIFNGNKLVLDDGQCVETATVYSGQTPLVGLADIYQPGNDVESLNVANDDTKAFFKAINDRNFPCNHPTGC